MPYFSEGLRITKILFKANALNDYSRRKGYHIGCCLVIPLTALWQRIVISVDLLVTENGDISKACTSHSGSSFAGHTDLLTYSMVQSPS